MSLFFNFGDFIFVNDPHNLVYNQRLECIETTSDIATFITLYGYGYVITLNQYQAALDEIQGIKITKEDNPEYWL